MIDVAKCFNLNILNIEKHKSYFLCDTKSGLFAIKKVMESPKNINLAHKIKIFLNKKNFFQVDKFYLSNQNIPFVIHNDNAYILTDLTESNSVDFGDSEIFLYLVATIAKMHNHLRNTNIKAPIGPDLSTVYENSLKNLVSIKKKIYNQSNLSDFDVLFLKNQNNYIEDINNAKELLSNTKYIFLRNKAVFQNSICHNNLRKESLIFSNNQIYITNFFGSTVDYYLVDLCNIILNHIKFSLTPVSISDIINTYSKFNQINDFEIKVLYAMLLYPYKLIKICKIYYGKKRGYVPNGLLANLQNNLEKREALYKYISSIK